MKRRHILQIATTSLLLTACDGGSPSRSGGVPVPGPGQWVAFGGNEPVINNSSFAFPGPSGVAGYFYTKPPLALKHGQTVTLTYNVDGNSPVWQQSPHNPQDINPPTMHLFLWRSGDDLTCNGPMASYRFFAVIAPLKLGDNQTLTITLDPSLWTNCYGKHDAAGFIGALNNAMGIGFTFGGQYFAGHGIYVQSGSATFTVKGLSIQ